MTVQPRNAPAMHRRLLDAWWRDYAAPRRLLQQKPDYPPQVETYLVNNLARRLNLRLPRQRIEESGYQQFEHELSALDGQRGHPHRAGTGPRARPWARQCCPPTSLCRPLPKSRRWIIPTCRHRPAAKPDGQERRAEIEPIARHVPAEFFYIRFGSFENFLWFQDTLDTWGGDLQNLVAMRGLNDQRNLRIQDQLVWSRRSFPACWDRR